MKKWTLSALASILLIFPAVTALGDPPPDDGPSGLPVFQMPIGPGAESKNGEEKKDDDEAQMREKKEKEKEKELRDKKVDDAIKKAWEEK